VTTVAPADDRAVRRGSFDDHPLLRAGIAGLIADEPDMEVVAEAENGRDAIEKFTRHRPDVTLMDLQMPDMGGVAAVTDALQGLLILAFTIVMIPLGLVKVGGFSGLHERVPEFYFELFGTAAMSDYAWYSILAITFTSMIQMFGLLHNMQMAGSAKDENTARFGQIVGAFTKRLVIVAWTLCGILAIALLPGGMPDTELAWGQLAKVVLAPGLMGLMISGMLLGHMPAVGANAIAVSALLSRNVYEPLVKGKTGRHYLVVGQIFVVTTLVSGIIVPLLFTGAVKLITTVITFNAFFVKFTFA